MIIKLYVKVTLTVFFCHFRLRNLLQRKHMSTSKVEDLTSYLLLDNGRPFDCSIKALLNKIMITFYNNTQLPPSPMTFILYSKSAQFWSIVLPCNQVKYLTCETLVPIHVHYAFPILLYKCILKCPLKN